jgi:hypothetical protein
VRLSTFYFLQPKKCVFRQLKQKAAGLPATTAARLISKGPVNRVVNSIHRDARGCPVVSGCSEFRAVVSGSSLSVIGAKEGQASADICNNSEEASDGPGSIPVYPGELTSWRSDSPLDEPVITWRLCLLESTSVSTSVITTGP